MDHYAGELTMREAREQYFVANGFGAGGNYHKKWEVFRLGPIPLPIPNPPARVRALQYHDLHHVLTGYETDWRSEFEISAWEVAGGCGREWVAWALNLAGFAGGLMTMPRRTIAAFMRGRRGENLYGEDPEAYLDRRVDEVRAAMGVDRSGPAVGADWRALWGWGALALLWGALHFAVLIVPLVALVRWLA